MDSSFSWENDLNTVINLLTCLRLTIWNVVNISAMCTSALCFLIFSLCFQHYLVLRVHPKTHRKLPELSALGAKLFITAI